MSPSRRWLRATAHVSGLWALVVAQPLLDVLARAPEFFVAHRADALDVVALTALLLGAGPIALGALLGLAALVGRRTADGLTAFLVGLLLALFGAQVAYRLGATGWHSTGITVVACLAVGAIAWWRWRAARQACSVLAVAALAVPVVFLSGREIRVLLRSGPATTLSRHKSSLAPVVLVVFDELPLVSLIDASGRIDAVRYPHLAALASDGVWFRNATTVSDYTRWALPAILTGRYPRPGTMPTTGDHPDNLFTLLAPAYRMEVTEPLTALCPPQWSGRPQEPRATRHRRMLADVEVVAAHTWLPPDARTGLPDVTADWAGFSEDDDDARARWRRGERTDPYTTAMSFIDGIAAADEQPTLYFLHTLVSHHPPRRLPSGQGIANFVAPPGMLRGMVWTNASWPVSQFQQGALVQAGLVDTLVGRLRARLEHEGLYDRALVVITADHGISFTPGTRVRDFTEGGADGIVPVPLIVKLPAHGRERPPGTIDDGNVETIDVLPTIADALGVRLMSPVDGTSLLGSGTRRAAKRVAFDRARRARRFDPSEMARLRDLAAARKAATFGSDAWPVPSLPGLEGLTGRPVSAFDIAQGTATLRLQVDNMHALDDVDPAAPELPVQVKGRVLEAGDAASSVFLAIALNDTIEATTRTWSSDGRWFSLLPPDRLRRGRNHLEVFVVDPARPARLTPTRVNLVLPAHLNLLSPEAPQYGVAYKGFHHAEQVGSTRYHWTYGDAAITVPVAEGFAPARLEVDVVFTGREGKRLRILIDDCEVVSEVLPDGRWTRSVPLGACAPRGRWAAIRFVADTHRSDRDARRLGVALARVSLRE